MEVLEKENRFRAKSLQELPPMIKKREINLEKEVANFPLESVYGSRIFVVEEIIVEYSGIFLPENITRTNEMQTNIGWVIACGPECTDVKVGDRIFYARYSGAWVFDKCHRTMNECDILGIMKKDASLNWLVSGGDATKEYYGA